MKTPTFLEGVAVALLAALIGSVLFAALGPLLGRGVLQLVITGLGLGYVLYLLSRSREQIGRVTSLAGWCMMATLTWLATPPLSLYLMAHLSAVWVIRSLYYHTGVLPALVDLGLSGLALAAGVWALAYSGSLFLTIWSLFLVQALFVAIPSLNRDGPTEADTGERFARAHRSAESVLRKLSSNI